jgi:cellulose synthase/poly-beta-1,6-N-acetylglucosamine synthase-like glycosyltransferase
VDHYGFLVGDMVAAVNAHASSIPKILFVAIIIASVIMLPIVYLVFALVLAGVVMLFGKKIFLRKVSYGESYVYSLYALAPIVLFIEVITLLPYIGAVIAVIPLLKIFAVLWFLWYMFRTVEKSSVTKNPEVKTKSKEPKDDDVVIPKKAVSKKSKKSTIALDAATVPLTISVKPEKKSAKKNKKTIS